MRLSIHHHTEYRYGESVRRATQLLRLTPRSEAGLKVLEWSVSAPGVLREQRDAFGNRCHYLDLAETRAAFEILARGEVDTSDCDGRIGDDGRLPLATYRTPTVLVPHRARTELPAALQEPVVAEEPELLALARRVAEVVRYQSGSTDVDHDALEVLSLGQGVCQDQAHVFLLAARAHGLPARYVSGYLDVGEPGHLATHAWVDVWQAAHGCWLSIDVTHARRAATGYCRLAVGRDYRDAAPIRGVRQGGGTESLSVTVEVRAR